MNPRRIQWLLALVASVTASAQPPRPPRGDRMPPPLPPLSAIFDTNHDMVLSADEIQAASTSLAKLDKNRDGKITLDELRMPPPNGGNPPKGPKGPKDPPPGKPPAPPVIAALDTDGDGTLSAAELANAPDSLKTLDKDGDGALAPEELHPDGPPPRADGLQGPPPADGGPDVQ